MNTTTVRDNVSPRWIDQLADELLGIRADGAVGERCVALCSKADALVALMDETDAVALMTEATAKQCHTWYFG